MPQGECWISARETGEAGQLKAWDGGCSPHPKKPTKYYVVVVFSCLEWESSYFEGNMPACSDHRIPTDSLILKFSNHSIYFSPFEAHASYQASIVLVILFISGLINMVNQCNGAKSYSVQWSHQTIGFGLFYDREQKDEQRARMIYGFSLSLFQIPIYY